MEDFTVIETQEQLDKVIEERLKQGREEVEKKYEGFLSPEEARKKYEGYIAPEEAAKKDAQIKGYETAAMKARIANEVGLPYEMAARLSGDKEVYIRKDAQALQKLMGGRRKTPPLADTEGNKGDKDAALKEMLHKLNGKGD